MKFVIAILRGALGGVVGGFVWVLVFVLLASQPIGGNFFQVLAVTYILSGLPFGLFVGAIVGLIVWMIHKRKAVTLTFGDRLILGIVIAALVRSISLALQNNVG